jgi:membrane-associated protein
MELFFGADIVILVKTVGYLGIFAIIFAESGLFAFLPGDSLLFTAGFLASQGFLNITILMLISFLGAVLGDSTGYAFGRKIGPHIFTKEDSIFFNKDHLTRAESFYNQYGAKTIVIARFIPIVRTFAPILAGVGRMRYGEFVFYNIFGGALWAFGISGLGYYLGNVIPNIDRYLLPIIAGIIFLSISPGVYHLVRNKKNRDQIIQMIARTWKRNKNS